MKRKKKDPAWLPAQHMRHHRSTAKFGIHQMSLSSLINLVSLRFTRCCEISDCKENGVFWNIRPPFRPGFNYVKIYPHCPFDYNRAPSLPWNWLTVQQSFFPGPDTLPIRFLVLGFHKSLLIFPPEHDPSTLEWLRASKRPGLDITSSTQLHKQLSLSSITSSHCVVRSDHII